jgi:hypothetical protein
LSFEATRVEMELFASIRLSELFKAIFLSVNFQLSSFVCCAKNSLRTISFAKLLTHLKFGLGALTLQGRLVLSPSSNWRYSGQRP